MHVAVLMMAYGGPNSLDDVEPYLSDVRGGRPTSPALVEEIRGRYARIGGRSPLLAITRAQAVALEACLNEVQDGGVPAVTWRVYVGMRHWYPYIGEAVMQIVRDGFTRVVGLCMAPYYSRASIGAYYAKLEQARQASGVPLELIKIEHWHEQPLFIDALTEKIRAAQPHFTSSEREQVTYLFTAHSLPSILKEQGDPYDGQLHETAERLAATLELGRERWQLCYQSAGASGGPWMGPAVEDVIKVLAQAGKRAILVAPIGFVADHVEILYDIDIECRRIAQAHGVHLERTESLNAAPTLIAAMAKAVLTAAGEPGDDDTGHV